MHESTHCYLPWNIEQVILMRDDLTSRQLYTGISKAKLEDRCCVYTERELLCQFWVVK